MRSPQHLDDEKSQKRDLTGEREATPNDNHPSRNKKLFDHTGEGCNYITRQYRHHQSDHTSIHTIISYDITRSFVNT
jgi:hypothetical protein